MSNAYTLDTGIALQLHDASPNDEAIFNSPHTLQVLSVKKVGTKSESTANVDRYRLILSDGAHFVQAMLATQLNHMINDDTLGKHTIVVVERLSCNYVQEKRLLILMALRVIGQETEKIGNPVTIGEGDSTSAATTPAPQKPSQPQQSRPTPSTTTTQRQPSAKSSEKGNWHPIEGLSPYQNNWTIKARVTQKSDMKTWSNQRGEGKLFNLTLMDETGEIRATAFNQQAELLYSKFEEGKVYFVSKAKVNLAKKKFSNIQNDYELSLEKNTEVEECLDTSNLPMIKYNFVTLSDLHGLDGNATCDVIAICKEVGDVSEITTKSTSRTMKKRELTLVDKSGFSTRLTLWGNQAENFKTDEEAPVIAFKGVRVSDFGGRTLSMVAASTMTQNPDISEAYSLRGWYDSAGSNQSFQAHTNSGGSFAGTGGGFNRSELKSLVDIKTAANAIPETEQKPSFFSTRATIMHIKSDNIAYPACQSEGCNKKVVEDSGSWRCEKCSKSFPEPSWRYIIAMAVSDYSGQAWLQGFNDVGEVIFDRKANDLVDIRNNDEAQFNVIMLQATCRTYNFFVRANRDTYNEINRVRYGISRISKLDYKEEAEHLLSQFDSPWGQQELRDANAMMY